MLTIFFALFGPRAYDVPSWAVAKALRARR
jgi:hypothetical protein